MVPRWLTDAGKPFLESVAIVGGLILVVIYLPEAIVVLLPPDVVETMCGGAFLCLPALSILWLVSIVVYLSILAWLADGGHLSLSDAW